MSLQRQSRRRQQGYVLLFVVLLSAAIVTSAGTVAMLSEVEARSSTRNVRAVQAMAIAYSGLLRGLKAVDNDRTLAIGRLNDLLGGSTPQTLDGVNFNQFVSAPDMRTGGTSYSLGDGRYKLFLLDDVEERDSNAGQDSNRTVVIRSYGWVGESEAMLEAPFTVPVLTSFPGALVACLEDPGGTVWFGARGGGNGGLGPGWPRMHWRVDGSKNKFNEAMPAILTGASNPYTMNGFARTVGGAAYDNKWLFLDNPDRAGNQYGGAYFTWFGWGGAPPATSGENHVVDEGYGMGTPSIGTNAAGQRPLGMAALPQRFVSKNFILNSAAAPVTSTGITRYKAPTVAWGSGHADHANYEHSEYEFEYADGDRTDFVAKSAGLSVNGFYGCPNNSDSDDNAYQTVGACLSGTPHASSGLGETDMNAPAVTVSDGDILNEAGLAWNVIQTVLRKCSGSGAGAFCCAGANNPYVPCDADYRAFENVAKCLILPANVKRNWGAMGDFGGTEADYQDRTATAVSTSAIRHSATGHERWADSPPDSADKSWWPSYYDRLDINTAAWTGLSSTKALATKGLCETQYPAGWNAYAPAQAYHDGSTACGVIGTACAMGDSANSAPCGRMLVKYCDKEDSTFANGRARAYTAGTGWSWVDCLDERAWAPESCDDGYSMSMTDFFGLSQADNRGAWNATFTDTDVADGIPDYDACDDYRDAPGCCGGDWTETDGALDRLADMGNPRNGIRGDFTSCAPGCAFEWDPGSGDGGAAIAAGGNRTTSGTNYWRSACINLDPYHVHKYGPAGSPTQKRGERGSPHFISRLDLSDDGPMGSCNHAKADYRILKDRGTCLTGGRDNFTAFGVPASPCFTDADCGGTMPHPGVGMTAPFSRTVDDQDAWLPATKTPAEFCETGTGATDSLISLMQGVLDAANSVHVSSGTFGSGGSITDNGAVCKYSTTKVNGVELGWYVESCSSWDAYQYGSANTINGVICGCGVLGFKVSGGTAKMLMNKNRTDEAVVWRGLVVFASGAASTEVEIDNTDNGHKVLFIDGGLLGLSTNASINLWASVNPTGSETARTYIRFNQHAIDQALSEINLPLRGFRILY